MKRNCIIWAILIFIISLIAEQPPKGIINLVDAYKLALSEREISHLDGLLAKGFDFAGAGPELSGVVLEQIVRTGAMKIGEIENIEVAYDGDTARVIITGEIIAGGVTSDASESFDAVQEDGVWKIACLGKGALQAMVIEDPTQDAEFELKGPPKTYIDFNPDYDHIIIEALIDDSQKVNIIIDNGSPITIIDQAKSEVFDKVGEVAGAQAMGVSGEIDQTGAVRIGNLKVGELEIKNLTALTMDISHLSDALDLEIIGLLGTDFLGKFAWTIDYSSSRLILIRLNKDGNVLAEDSFMDSKPVYTIEFERTLHLLVVKALFGKDISANVVLDCGAGGGVITPEFYEKLDSKSYEISDQDTLVGADKEKTVVESIIPNKLEIQGVERDDYKIVISDLSHINSQGLPIKIDGIIGYNFFADWLITTIYNQDKIELRNIPK